ncbi:MAG: DDE-type integrase/transposase/recombinase [Nitrospirota bacterium]
MKNIKKYHYRFHLISLLDKKFYTAKQVSKELNITERHVRRLLSKFRRGGKTFFAIQPKPRPPAWNGTTQDMISEILRLKKEKISRSNRYIAEMIARKFQKKISSESIRSILIKNDYYIRTKRERRVFRKLEELITHSGQMVQLDVCEGAWLEGYRRIYLIAFMDAYSRFIVGWKWVDSNNAWNNILVLRSIVRKYGVPGMFYTDNASFYKVIRHNKSIYQKHKPDDEYETTIQRIILDLGSVMVNHKPYQPQGKGRLERFFWFMQERFIKEHTAKNLDELNNQFRKWVNWYNTEHVIRTIGCVPKDRFNPKGFKPVPKDLNLEKVFSYQYTRKVDKYNSFSFEGADYVIDSKNCGHFGGTLSGCSVELCVTPNSIIVYHHERRIQKFKRTNKPKCKHIY